MPPYGPKRGLLARAHTCTHVRARTHAQVCAGRLGLVLGLVRLWRAVAQDRVHTQRAHERHGPARPARRAILVASSKSGRRCAWKPTWAPTSVTALKQPRRSRPGQCRCTLAALTVTLDMCTGTMPAASEACQLVTPTHMHTHTHTHARTRAHAHTHTAKPPAKPPAY
jgi:hypothetical protein